MTRRLFGYHDRPTRLAWAVAWSPVVAVGSLLAATWAEALLWGPLP
jgi:hypothetical protein